MKKALIICGSIVAVFIGFVLAVMFFFPKEKIKEMAMAKGSKSLGRPLQIGDVSVSLWGGFGAVLHDVVIASPPGFEGEPLVSIKAVDIKVSLLPLLSGIVQIEKLVINEPHLSLLKHADGSVNYVFPADTTTAPKTDSSAGQQLAIGRMEIERGSIHFQNDSTQLKIAFDGLGLETSGTLKDGMSKIAASLKIASVLIVNPDSVRIQNGEITANIGYNSTSKEISIDSYTISIAPFECSGTGRFVIGDSLTTGKAEFRLLPIRVDQLFTLLPVKQREMLKGYTVDGSLAGNGEISLGGRDSSRFLYQATFALSALSAKSNKVQGELRADSLILQLSSDANNFRLAGGSFDRQPLSLSGHITNDASKSFDVTAAGAIDLAIVRPFIPDKTMTDFSGRASVDLEVRGKVLQENSLQARGQLVLQDVHFNDSLLPEPITDFDAQMKLSGDSVLIQSCDMKFTSSDIHLKGTALHLVPWIMAGTEAKRAKVEKPDVQFIATSHRFDSDKMFPEATPGARLDSSAILPDSLSSTLFPNFIGRGTFAIDTLIYCKLDLTQVMGKIDIKDKIVHCTDVNGKVYSGSLVGGTSIDFTNFNAPVYAGTFEGKGIEANDFVSRFTPLKGLIYGKSDLSGTFGATGWEPIDFLKSMTLDGKSLVYEARLISSGPIRDALTTLAGKVGSSFDGEQAIKELTASFKVKNGRVSTASFSLPLGNFGTMTFGGSYGFDNTADGSGTITLSEEASQKLVASGGVFAGLLGGKTGHLALPFAIGGSITKPTFSVDYQKAIASSAEQAKEAAESAAKNAVQKGLGEAGNKVDSTLTKAAKGLLNGLLKKP